MKKIVRNRIKCKNVERLLRAPAGMISSSARVERLL